MPGLTKTIHCIFLRERDFGSQKRKNLRTSIGVWNVKTTHFFFSFLGISLSLSLSLSHCFITPLFFSILFASVVAPSMCLYALSLIICLKVFFFNFIFYFLFLFLSLLLMRIQDNNIKSSNKRSSRILLLLHAGKLIFLYQFILTFSMNLRSETNFKFLWSSMDRVYKREFEE